MSKKVLEALFYLPRLPFLSVIWMYQKTLSPDHGPLAPIFPNGYCKFYPSCSEYGRISYEEHGVVKGTILTSYRILRCNPWTEGGHDHVPEKGEVIKTIKAKRIFS